ncbi:phage repressor protein/antirepressor Ant, partial [Listeria monocytogenes]|nr:phage repressor protein/antirepressor Ant [Listeria monocytogenes]
LGLFKIKETAIIRSSGAQTAITAKVTGKGQLYFVNKFLEQSLKTI